MSGSYVENVPDATRQEVSQANLLGNYVENVPNNVTTLSGNYVGNVPDATRNEVLHPAKHDFSPIFPLVVKTLDKNNNKTAVMPKNPKSYEQ